MDMKKKCIFQKKKKMNFSKKMFFLKKITLPYLIKIEISGSFHNNKDIKKYL